jgi:hypothetical protein
MAQDQEDQYSKPTSQKRLSSFLSIEDAGYYLAVPMQGLQTLPCLKDEKFDARLDWYEGVCKNGVVRGEKC